MCVRGLSCSAAAPYVCEAAADQAVPVVELDFNDLPLVRLPTSPDFPMLAVLAHAFDVDTWWRNFSAWNRLSYDEYFQVAGSPNWNVTEVSWTFAHRLFAAEGADDCVVGIECDWERVNEDPAFWRRRCDGFRERRVPCFGLRIPTEEEWEYAARAGTTTQTWAGDLPVVDDVCLSIPWLQEIASYCSNPSLTYEEWNALLPNPWGLYGMVGGSAEWTSTTVASDAGVELPAGAQLRVIRGAHFSEGIEALDVARRQVRPDHMGYSDVGFRLVRDTPGTYVWTGRMYTRPDGRDIEDPE